MKNLLKLLFIFTLILTVSADFAIAQLPQVEPLPDYTKGDYQIVTWHPGSWIDSSDVSAFLLEWSRKATFSPLLDAAKNIDLSETVIIRIPEDAEGILLPEDTIWYRVVAVKGVNTRIYSEPRASVQDQTPPILSTIELLADGQPVGEMTNNSNLTASFSLEEPAGLDTVGLYYRIVGMTTWSLLTSWPTPGTLDFEYDLSNLIISTGDNFYQFAVGAMDLARPAGWPDSTGPGNELTPSDSDISVGFDRTSPTASIDITRLDSLYAVDSVMLYWSASDLNTPYYSGLDEVTLIWSAYDSPSDELIHTDTLPLGTGGGAAALADSAIFDFDYDNAYYVFRIEAKDRVGNIYTSTPYDSVRVQKGLQAGLTLYDRLDPNDTEYVDSRTVGVTVAVPGASRADSLYLCTSLDPGSINTCRRYHDVPLPFDTVYTFAGDSTQGLYLQAWVGGALLTDHAEITVDPFAPEDVSIVLLTTSGSGSVIQMRFEGIERPFGELQAAIVWEEGLQYDPQVLPLSSFNETVTFRLSEGFDEKIILARLEDRAENRSEIAQTKFLRIDKPHSFPNPFNPDEGQSAQLVFLAEDNTDITISIYDLLGNLVLERTVPAGTAGIKSGESDPNFRWDGHNGRGEAVAGGGYICVLEQNGSQIGTIKIAVVR
ncbi:MAG TPA: hypothetical protein PLF13_11510 [candidate division Zixibacteria bacterium]|nr:hypothetical protein [candidate division Zixibacteria bacterium]